MAQAHRGAFEEKKGEVGKKTKKSVVGNVVRN
jgi:hypothetical protein